MEVPAKARRRRFSAQYKREILDGADACKRSPGAVGALLRREGLYSSHLTTRRKQREKWELGGLAPKKRGRKVKPINSLGRKIRALEVENRRLQKQLGKAESILSFQKILGDVGDLPGSEGRRQAMLMAATENLAGAIDVAPACEGLGVARSTLYQEGQPKQEPKPRPKPVRALSDGERQKVFDDLHGDRVELLPLVTLATPMRIHLKKGRDLYRRSAGSLHRPPSLNAFILGYCAFFDNLAPPKQGLQSCERGGRRSQ